MPMQRKHENPNLGTESYSYSNKPLQRLQLHDRPHNLGRSAGQNNNNEM
jgi:hypothetical protein